jgi:hypothetical protein
MVRLSLLVGALLATAGAGAAAAAADPASAAAAARSATVAAAYVAACGAPCARAGLPHSQEPGLTVSALGLDPAGTGLPYIAWASTASPSLLDTPAHAVQGSVFAVYANATFPLGSINVTSLFSAVGDDGLTPAVTSWPAAARGQVLAPEFEDALNAFPTCPDTVVIALQVIDTASGAAVGEPVYSPAFGWCYSALNPPDAYVTSPLEAMDTGATYVGGASTYTVNWTSNLVPWSQRWDIALVGYDFSDQPVPSVGGDDKPDGRFQVVPIAPSAAISPLVAFNLNGDGTGLAYSAVFTMPLNASGCWLLPQVTATLPDPDPASALAVAWAGEWNVIYGDAYSFTADPASLNASISLACASCLPLYDSLATIGSSITVSWSAVGLLPTDILYLYLVNADTGDFWGAWGL